jgi:hypothetical protein
MKTALYLLGLFLAAMAFVAMRSASQHDWDVVELLLGAALLAGAVAVLRKTGKLYDSTKPPA